MEVAKNLTALGNDLLVVLPGYKPLKKDHNSLNIIYVPTFRKSIISYLIYQLLQPVFLFFLILKFKPDVVYTREGLFDVFAAAVTKALRKPFVLEVNGIIEDELLFRGININIIKMIRIMESFTFKLSDRMVCVTEGISKLLVNKYNVKEKNVFVISNGVNTDLFHPIDKLECRKKLGLPEDDFIVGFVGTFAPWQGLIFLLKAVKEIKEAGDEVSSNISFILVGDGEQEMTLRTLAREYGIESLVHFAGRVEYEEVVYWINAFDVAVAPFTRERNSLCGLSPLKMYEYLACGKPVIASDIEGIRDIVGVNKCGLLFNPNDVNELIGKIINLYSNKDSFLNIGEVCSNYVKTNYSWRNIAMILEYALKN
ncbi:glycosyltransferase family 4 protein [Pelotomaculum propionicicum]|uniref:glycosyltransferase family 4 protein n=1 Tax=Pelotomaculum propionicicum TaxID=258475 RepID=UPI003BA15071